jgi:LmbE family N-acetylglucosaminyl deacetylase
MSSVAGVTERAAVAVADRTIRGEGTSEAEWAAWPGWQRGSSSLVEVMAATARLVVVAPHPDDETIGAGGLIHDAAAAGRDVLVIGVTDGGASHPGSSSWPNSRLTTQRRVERATALRCLGVQPAAIAELGLADGDVAANVDQLAECFHTLLRASDLVVSPWRYDGHPDHEATALAVATAAESIGARHRQVPIWGWHWATPSGTEIPYQNAVIYSLDDRARAAKVRAIECFVSQLRPDSSTGAGPILPRWALQRMLRDREVLLA